MTTAVKVREGADQHQGTMKQELLLPGDWERMEAVRASSKFILPVGTQWVEADVLGIANEVSTRWPNLQIASCQCGKCLAAGHYPHVVLEHTRNNQTVPVFGFVRLNRDVIHRLQAIHSSQDPLKKHLEQNEQTRAVLKKEADAAQKEQLEVIESALRSHKHDWKGPNGMRTDPRAKVVR